jgi:hypothetical protein
MATNATPDYETVRTEPVEGFFDRSTGSRLGAKGNAVVPLR